MSESGQASTELSDEGDVRPSPTDPLPRMVIKRDLVMKILAVLGVVFLVYVLIYLGTWLAMLN